MRRGPLRGLTALLAIALGVTVLGGCSDGEGDAATTTTSPLNTSTTTIVVDDPGKLDADDQAAAEAAVLAKADLPADWKTAPWTTGEQPFFRIAKGECVYLHDADDTAPVTAFADSEALRSPTNTTVAMQVKVYPTEAEAEAVLASFTKPDAAKCIRSTVAVTKNEAGVSGGGELELGPSAVTVPGAVAFYGLTEAGGIKLGIGYAVAQKGRAVVLLTATALGTEVPAFDTYLTPTLDRLEELG